MILSSLFISKKKFEKKSQPSIEDEDYVAKQRTSSMFDRSVGRLVESWYDGRMEENAGMS